MAISLSSKEFSLIQKYIEDKSGIKISSDKAYLIESRLSNLLIELGCSSYEELYHIIYTHRDQNVAEKVIDEITTNETLWFRDKTPWYTLVDILLPHYIKQLESDKLSKVRIWSAGCSTGQEPYSTAMAIYHYLIKHNLKSAMLHRFEIIATDISQTVLDTAKLGKYDNISVMRGLTDEYRDEYLKNEGTRWSLSDEIKNMVKFKKFNLQNDFILLGSFDIIFCRYVMIYFSQQFKAELAEKFAGALKQSGILFIGSSEVFTGYNKLFDMEKYKNGIYYRKKINNSKMI